ncbi:predicted protein [Pyrenophora tritici-repentis Pt-1C-BFP]|uniref:Uncharacterized protein n=1 Tax=Pyrenophora tritici-repentis (strain Pt-1C-BFP) TaxID=426418 RepID=B2W672_PYRTR|nr:uncharacterized protein PTRG_05310 [Pyrenophora tritici-repentis Pt-1C-BFP]EDU48230.1 predicted protein [Pyrenophora tritici-repentis Pt-1C-BFP]
MSLDSANRTQGEVDNGYGSVIPDFLSDTSFSLAATLQMPVDAEHSDDDEDAFQGSPTFTATLQAPFQQPDVHFLASTFAPSTPPRTNPIQQSRHTRPSHLHLHLHRRPSTMSAFSFEQATTKKATYYSHALSSSDKLALAHGEKNHNHKEWTPKDLVTHHEARKDLVPGGVMPKMDKVRALAGIECDRQDSRRALAQEVKDQVGTTFMWRVGVFADDVRKGKEEGAGYTYTYDYAGRMQMTSDTPSPPSLSLSPRRPSLPLSQSYPNLTIATTTSTTSSHHVRATSTGDYFSHHQQPRSTRPARRSAHRASRNISPLASVSGTSSDSSTRVRSPLAQEVRFRRNPEVTFDAFLVPHKSGKGEAFVDAVNARGVEEGKMGVGVEDGGEVKGMGRIGRLGQCLQFDEFDE